MLGGHINYLGLFATAEEAALAVARFFGPAGAAPPPEADEYQVDAEDVVVDGEEEPLRPPTPARLPTSWPCSRKPASRSTSMPSSTLATTM